MNLETVIQLLRSLLDAVAVAPPVVLFVALVALPLVGCPASPLWVAMGIRMGTFSGLFLSLVALLANFSLGYWIAARLGHGWISQWFARRDRAVPRFEAADEVRWILLVRITPGIPLFVQNYALGLARVNFGRYLMFSLPVQGLYAALFTWFGTSLTQSRFWPVLLSAAGLIAAVLLVSLVRCRLRADDSVKQF